MVSGSIEGVTCFLDIADHGGDQIDTPYWNAVGYLVCREHSIPNVAEPEVARRCSARPEDWRGFGVAQGVVNNLDNNECHLH